MVEVTSDVVICAVAPGKNVGPCSQLGQLAGLRW